MHSNVDQAIPLTGICCADIFAHVDKDIYTGKQLLQLINKSKVWKYSKDPSLGTG